MRPILISFFTNDWQYPQHGERLKGECRNLGIQYDIQELPSAGGYLQNTCMKPQFILEMLKKHKQPVLWVDVDASIYATPDFFNDLEVDFSGRPKVGRQADGRKWHVGTMWFNYTPKTLIFLERWVELSNKVSDELALHELWGEFQDITYVEMPESYHRIMNVDSSRGVVISHRISSGRSKKLQTHLFQTNTPFSEEFKKFEIPKQDEPYHVCVLKSGGEYTPAHVQWLAKQVPNLICLSDVPVEGVNTVKLRKNWGGWWSKLELFSDIFSGDVLYFDLDTVVLCDVKDLYMSETTVLKDFYHPERMGSGLMYISQRDKRIIWKTFLENPMLNMAICQTRENWGDQGFLNEFIGKAQKWQDVVKGIYSYKVHCTSQLPSDAKVVCFHGQPRPWGVTKDWIPNFGG